MYRNSSNKSIPERDVVFSPPPKTRRSAPSTPPSPPSLSSREEGKSEETGTTWGDLKPIAKTKAKQMAKLGEIHNSEKVFDNSNSAYKYSSDIAFQDVSKTQVGIETEETLSKTKDGVLFPKNSPKRSKIFPSKDGYIGPRFVPRKTNESETNDSNDNSELQPGEKGNVEIARDTSGKMSKSELIWASIVFVLVILLTLATTVIITDRQTRRDIQKNKSKKNGDGSHPTGAVPSTNSGDDGVTQSKKITIQEEFELVYSAIFRNNVTRVLVEGENGIEASLPNDIYFYNRLISGMLFSEEERDWIPQLYDDDLSSLSDYDIYGDAMSLDDMSMGGTVGELGSNSQGDMNSYGHLKSLTPNQKAMTWLLFRDKLKDPNESVWRWAMASIYFKMGGHSWTFHNNSTNNSKWLTSAPLCEWERIYCRTLPVELDFNGFNMTDSIAIEFALFLLPPRNPVDMPSDSVASTTDTFVRSITLSDNQLTGTIPGVVFQYLMPALGKLYLDNNHLTGTIPLELGGLDTLYVQNNALTGIWPQEFCDAGDKNIGNFGLNCDVVNCSNSCCSYFNCYYSM